MNDPFYILMINEVMSRHHDTLSHIIEVVNQTVKTVSGSNPSPEQITEVLESFEHTLRSCDEICESVSLMLVEHLSIIAKRRALLTKTMADLAAMNNDAEGFLTAMEKNSKISSRPTLHVVDNSE